jgi:hypothetical protein
MFVNPDVLLAAAILSELAGTTALKLSEEFTRPVPSLGVVVGYGAAFYLLSLVLEELRSAWCTGRGRRWAWRGCPRRRRGVRRTR